MDVVIFCAGLGTRLRPLTNKIPKSLVGVNGVSPLENTLNSISFLKSKGRNISKVILVVNHKREKIYEKFGTNYKNVPIEYVLQKKLDGTFSALKICEDSISSKWFCALNGDDIYCCEDLEKILCPNKISVMVKEIKTKEESLKFGVFEVIGQKVVKVYEKQIIENLNSKKHFINVGGYAFSKEFFFKKTTQKTQRKEYELPQVFLGEDINLILINFWQPINTKEELGMARKNFFTRNGILELKKS